MRMKEKILTNENIKLCPKYERVLHQLKNIGVCIIDKFIIINIKFYSYFWFFYSSLFNKPVVHAIGDSHTKTYKKTRLFIVHHIGPATAYNLNKDTSNTNSKKKVFAIINKLNKKKDIVMLVFGEIDCRIHIYNQYRRSSGEFTIDMLINNTVSNYGQILEQLKHMGINFFVLGIPPASKQKNIYGYTFYAPPEIRSRINMEFNEKMKKYCIEKGIKYMDIYSKVSDKDGFILVDYAADEVHLNKKAGMFVRNWLDKEMGIKL